MWMWSEGRTLENKAGIVLLCKEPDAERAEAAMDRGETVGLTRDGVVVSHMKVKDGAYTEIPIR